MPGESFPVHALSSLSCKTVVQWDTVDCHDKRCVSQPKMLMMTTAFSGANTTKSVYSIFLECCLSSKQHHPASLFVNPTQTNHIQCSGVFIYLILNTSNTPSTTRHVRFFCLTLEGKLSFRSLTTFRSVVRARALASFCLKHRVFLASSFSSSHTLVASRWRKISSFRSFGRAALVHSCPARATLRRFSNPSDLRLKVSEHSRLASRAH